MQDIAHIPNTEIDEIEIQSQISISQYLSAIIRLLKKEEDTPFWKVWIDNNRSLCSRLDEIVDFLWDKNRKTEALRFLDSFDTPENIGKREVEIFLNELQELEDIGVNNRPDDDNPLGTDKQSQYRKVEILRKLFVAFWVTKNESRWHTNPILNTYIGYIEDRYYGRTGMIDFDKFLDFELDTPNGVLFLWLREGGTSTEVWELISEVVEIVEAIHWADIWEDWEPIEDAGTRWSRPSWKKQWAERRRLRDREAKDKRTQEELQKEKEREYQQKIQELKSYWEQVKSELQRLQGFLLTHIPYVTEVLDYLHLDHRLKQEWYLEEWENIWDVRSQILGTIEWLESDCSESRSTIHALEAEISWLSSRLIQVNSDWLNNWIKVKTLQKRLDRKTAKINREKNRLEEIEVELRRISGSVEDIISQLEGFRFKCWVPNIDEFEAWIYYSLDTENMYSMPERINQPPVTVQWIEQNILHIFRKILWKYFEWNNISIVDIWDLVEKIDTLEPEYHEDTPVPDTETIDLSSIRDFIDTLLTIIPQKYIDEIPVFWEWRFKLITPELFIWNPPKIEKQKPQIDYDRNRKKEEKNKRNAILDEKIRLRKDIDIMEREMIQYIQYWNNKLRGIFRKKRTITNDIESITKGMPWQMSNQGKTIEQLEDLLKITNNEFEVIQEKRQNDKSLLQNQERYDTLEKKRWALQRKLQSLK